MLNTFSCVLLDAPAEDGAVPSLALLDGAPGAPAQASAAGRLFASFALPPRALRPLCARTPRMVAVGDVRLDNRHELDGAADPAAPDLEVVLRAFGRHGAACIPRLHGEFAFVLWDGLRLYAVRDALGVRSLYYRRTPDGVAFSSRPGNLAGDGRLDPEYAADFLLGGYARSNRTPWLGCLPVPPGSYLVAGDGALSVREYWSPRGFAPSEGGDEREQVERFGHLFRAAVRSTVEDGTWSQLSGGLDSSSIVSAASRLAAAGDGPGLAGTVSIVDSLGGGDETRYSDAVAERYGLANAKIKDYWAWRDDGLPPPRLDEPRITLPFWARDREMCRAVSGGGGRVLLSGHGPDVFLAGNFGYLADLLAKGRVRSAVRGTLEHAIAQRRSFWGALATHAVLPLVPSWASGSGGERKAAVPDWIDPDFARRTGMRERGAPLEGFAMRAGSRFTDEIVMGATIAQLNPERNPAQDEMELRYPFLNRPLVEFALQLPVEMRIRPSAQKWILREAMKGVLPEVVRTRRSKGSINARKIWSVRHERERLEVLLADSPGTRLGWIRGDRLRDAVRGADSRHQALFAALALETWLESVSGRWTG